MRTNQSGFEVAVLLQVPLALASAQAQTAFLGTSQPMVEPRVPNAAGSVKVEAGRVWAD